MPRASPNSSSVSTCSGSASESMPAQPARGRDQRRRLAADDLQVVRLSAARPRPELSTSRIWPSQSTAIVRASSRQTSVPEVGGDLRGPGEQEVAGEDGHRVVPARVRAGHPRRASASSITSSWYSVARWTSSIATEPGHQPRIGRVAEVARQQDEHRRGTACRPPRSGTATVSREQAGRLDAHRLLERLLDPVEATRIVGLERGVGRPRGPGSPGGSYGLPPCPRRHHVSSTEPSRATATITPHDTEHDDRGSGIGESTS